MTEFNGNRPSATFPIPYVIFTRLLYTYKLIALKKSISDFKQITFTGTFYRKTRIILFAGETTPLENDADSKLLEYIQSGNLNIEDKIYIPIKRDMFERMVITLGPDCTEAHKLIVLSLVKDYPNIEVYWSRLGDYPNYEENLNKQKLNA